MKTTQKRPPGKGERIALAGYVPQTHYQIDLILEHLLREELESIELASLRAETADDLILFLSGKRIRAYQFKHHSTGALTFAQLVDPDGTEPRLLHQMAVAWQALQTSHPDREVEVLLVTNRLASAAPPRKRQRAMDPLTIPLDQFIKDIWEPFREQLRKHGVRFPTTPASSQNVFTTWKDASGLSSDLFNEFAMAFSIVSGREPQPERWLSDSQDINHLYRHLQSFIAKHASSQEIIRITSHELKDLLGLDRFSYRNLHVFPVPTLYETIVGTRQQLLNALNRFDSGYIAVLGSPGSGKSTLLERMLRREARTERVIPYYAYVPDDPYPTHSRLEAENFLHDLVKRIAEDLNYPPMSLPPRNNLATLRQRLQELLRYLGQEFTEKEQKTIILVDGLDHVERSNATIVERSFLSVLPEPHQIPHGVIFVVGSQYLTLQTLPLAVRSQIETEPDRQLSVGALTPVQVEHLVDRSGLAQRLRAVSNEYVYRERMSQVITLSEGHPLALGLLLNHLRNSFEEDGNIDVVLQETPRYRESIYEQYAYLWAQIEEDRLPRMRDFVGQLVRLRREIDFGWVRGWEDCQSVERHFEKRFRHLFVKIAPNRWQFFHNSVRLFFIERSRETIDGPDATEDARYHRRLAERCRSSAVGSEHGWQLFYHLVHSGDAEQLFLAATPERFEEQYTAFRPALELAADAHLCLQRAADIRDPLRLARYLLLWHRYNHAANLWEETDTEGDLLQLLLKTDHRTIAIYRLLSAKHQITSTPEYRRLQQRKDFLDLLDHFAQYDANDVVATLLDTHEPSALLDGEVEWPADHDRGNLISLCASWMLVALRFHDASNLVPRLQQIRWYETTSGQRRTPLAGQLTPEAKDEFVQETLHQVAQRLLEQGRWESFEQVLQSMEAPWWKTQRTPFWWGRLIVDAIEASGKDDGKRRQFCDRLAGRVPVDRAMTILRQLSSSEEGIPLAIIETILGLAVGLLTEDDRCAEAYGALLDWPAICQPVARDLKGQAIPTPYLYAVEQYVTLLTYQGQPLPAPGTMADALVIWGRDEDRDAARRAYAIARIRLAILRGFALRAKAKRPVYHHEVSQQFAYLTTYFVHPARQGGRVYGKWGLESPGLVANVLADAATSAHAIGNDAIQAFIESVATSWDGREAIPPWPEEIRYAVASSLRSTALAATFAREEIARFTAIPLLKASEGNQNSWEWIRARLRRANDYVWLDQKAAAIEEVQGALLGAFVARAEKDYQLATFMSWVPQLIQQVEDEPGRIELVEEAVQQVMLCRLGAEGSTDAAAHVLKAVAEWSPRRACRLLHELFRDALGGYTVPEGAGALIHHFLSIEQRRHEGMAPGTLAALVGTFTTVCLGIDRYEQWLFDLAHDLVLAAPSEGVIPRREIAHRIWEAGSYAMPEGKDRDLLAHALADALPTMQEREAAGLRAEDIPPPDSPSLREGTEQPYALELQNGTTLHRDEVVRRLVENPADITELADNEKKYGDQEYRRFEWGRVLQRVFPHVAASAQNHILDCLIGTGHRFAEVFDLATHLASTGRLQNGMNIVTAAIEVTKREDFSRGWSRWYDGGERLAALRFLVTVDPEQYRLLAATQFVHALRGRLYVEGLVGHLRDIALLYVAESQFFPIANEVRQHRQKMFVGLNEDRTQTVLSCRISLGTGTSDSIAAACCGLLLDYLGSPFEYLAKRAMVELRWLAHIDRKLVTTELRRALHEANELTKERILLLCERLSQEMNLQVLQIDFERLATAENYTISQSARKILEAMGVSIPFSSSPIPFARVAAPAKPLLEVSGKPIAKQEVLSPLFEPWFQVLAELLHCPRPHIEDEVRAILVQEGWNDEVFYSSQMSLQEKYQRIRSSYISPRASATRQALKQYVGRLLHAGTLPDPLPEFFDVWVRGHDPALVGWWPIRRPLWAKPFARDTSHHLTEEEAIRWCQELDEHTVALHLLKEVCWAAPEENEQLWVIVGERSNFESGDTLQLSERRLSVVAVGPTRRQDLVEALTRHAEVFEREVGLLFSQYPQIDTTPSAAAFGTVVVSAENYWFDGVSSLWLGVHPLVMQQMQLTLDPQFPPCWRTGTGAIGCISVGWHDGTWAGRVYDDFPSGNGWSVLVRADLWSELAAQLNATDLKFVAGIRREVCRSGNREDKVLATHVAGYDTQLCD